MANYFRNENLKNFKSSKNVYKIKKTIIKCTIINFLYIVYSCAFLLLEKTYECKHFFLLKFQDSRFENN